MQTATRGLLYAAQTVLPTESLLHCLNSPVTTLLLKLTSTSGGGVAGTLELFTSAIVGFAGFKGFAVFKGWLRSAAAASSAS